MDYNLTFFLFLLGPPLAGELVFLFLLSRRRRPQESWFRNLLIIFAGCLLLVLLALAGGEAYYRFVYDTTDSMDVTELSRRWMRRYIIENSAGFRDNIEYHLRIEPGRRRVTFVGDSFVVGHGIKSVEDRFPNIIRRDQPDWEVHTLARSGYDTGSELDLMQLEFEGGYQADVVVLVYFLNDISDLMLEMRGELFSWVSKWAGGKGWLCRHSYFVDLLYMRYELAQEPMMMNYFEYVRDGYQGALWEEQQQRLRAFRDQVQSHGGKLLVVTFPFMQAVGPQYPYKFIHEELDRFWMRERVPHLDLLSVYSNLPSAKITVNHFDAHPNEYANALAAQVIEPFLRTNMAAATPPAP